MPVREAPFFTIERNKRAVRQLARAPLLTVIVGAGASAEVGFPSWSALVMGLLREIAADAGIKKAADVEAFSAWTIATDGLPGAGALAKSWLGARFEQAVREQLYASVSPDPLPGPTLSGLGRLQGAASGRCEIVTTNYDLLIENALRAEGFAAADVRTYVSRRRPPRGGVAVRHVHGVLTPTKQVGNVVLSEGDYHLMQNPTRWQERYFRDRLQRTTCLFVGTSLTDPNLLRYLYRTTAKQSHYAVFVRQGDEWRRSHAGETQVMAAKEEAAAKRWRAVGISPLFADYYIQSAQFVHEIARARSLGKRYETYEIRLQRWADRIAGGLMQTHDLTRFRQTQDELQAVLLGWVDAVRDYFRAVGVARPRERFALHLWARFVGKRGLVNLGASDRAWREPSTWEPVPIRRPTGWVAVEAFCSGIPILQGTEQNQFSRWNTVWGVPISLEDARWGHLPVGVFTLASTARLRESALAQLTPQQSDQVTTYLAENGAELLTP